MESVVGLLGRMDLQLAYFEQHPQYRGLVPFLQTYYFVTKAVLQQDFTGMEALDVRFGEHYFQPLQAWLRGGPVSAPWKTYYQYCGKSQGNAFLQLLLGVNAHINGDLAMSIAEVQYRNKIDFFRVDQVLAGVVPQTMAFLAIQQHDLIAAGALLLPQMSRDYFYDIAIRWRHQAWKNATKITGKNKTALRRKLNVQTEAVGRELVQLFSSREHAIHHRAELHQLQVVL